MKVEDRTLTREKLTRGCYVPVLTRLAGNPSKADLPSGLMAKRGGVGNRGVRGASVGWCQGFTDRMLTPVSALRPAAAEPPLHEPTESAARFCGFCIKFIADFA